MNTPTTPSTTHDVPTGSKVAPMPATTATPRPTGHTRLRNFRAADDKWAAAKDTAATRPETLTDVLVGALEAYTRDPDAFCTVIGYDAGDHS